MYTWKYVKNRIKNILDKPQITISEKILCIESLLDFYKKLNGYY